MPDTIITNGLRGNYNALVKDLDERARRRWAATEAESIGRGSVAAVALATGLSDRTVRSGIREIREGRVVPAGRQRRIGGERKPIEDSQPDLAGAIETLVEPTERGDPQSPLRLTYKGLTNLQTELRRQGYAVGRTKISEVLRGVGYSLQGNRKTREGKDHPDRDAQFVHINQRFKAYRRGERPAISVDTKKKENLGNKANVDREYRPKDSPREVDRHGIAGKKKAKRCHSGFTISTTTKPGFRAASAVIPASSLLSRYADGGKNLGASVTKSRRGY